MLGVIPGRETYKAVYFLAGHKETQENDGREGNLAHGPSGMDRGELQGIPEADVGLWYNDSGADAGAVVF